MKTLGRLVAPAAAVLCMLSPSQASAQAPAAPMGAELPPMPTARTPGPRVNKVIDLWSKGQPVYFTYQGAGDYEAGKRLASTTADVISYNLEHDPLDFSKLREFMRGLAEAGPTRSGHPTPTVIVTLPVPGTADAMRANQWMFQQALAAGVHGLFLIMAESPEAARMMVEASRYPFAPAVPGLAQGSRTSGSQNYASKMWGLTPSEYLRVADVWPLNPEGEIILGVKIETPRAVAGAESTLSVPGVAFAEWGANDNGFFLLGRPTPEGQRTNAAMVATRARVFAAAKSLGVKFLEGCNEANVIGKIEEGVMICSGGEGPAAAKGRAHTKRQDPW